MNSNTSSTIPGSLDSQAIEQQLERMFLHPDFCSSRILRKFLSFVVQETITGNANFLKEYTIALKVLMKPVNFNPQRNCIVRIHAGRLRKALYHYYNETGLEDEIIINLPKGKYVPVFMDRQQWLNEMAMHEKYQELDKIPSFSRLPIFAILPFNYNFDNKEVSRFVDGLCLQICSGLSQVKDVSVVSYLVVKSMAANNNDPKELSAMLHFNHIISVSVQHLKNRRRIIVQIIDCRFYQAVWSKVFDCNITDANLFEVQDGICHAITSQASNLIAVA